MTKEDTLDLNGGSMWSRIRTVIARLYRPVALFVAGPYTRGLERRLQVITETMADSIETLILARDEFERHTNDNIWVSTKKKRIQHMKSAHSLHNRIARTLACLQRRIRNERDVVSRE